MPRDLSHTVVLPDGEKVTVSRTPQPWWTRSNVSGYLDPRDIAPDLANPRKYMSPSRREELRESIRARGVRQQLVVTPISMAPWIRVAPEHEGRFFANVSGHRRQDGAIEAKIYAVPVKVVVFDSEKSHRMEMSLLNKGQDDLTPLEEGYEIVSLRALGWKIQELCDSFGHKLPQLYELIHLTRLHRDLQALLDPDLPRQSRLCKNTAGHLGGVKAPTADELLEFFETIADVMTREDAGVTVVAPSKLSPDDRRFAMQKMLFAVIRKRKLSAVQAVEFIRDHKLKLSASNGGHSHKAERYQPRRRKDLLETLVRQVTGSLVAGWPQGELRRVFGNDPHEEVERYVEFLKKGADVFGALIRELEAIKAIKKPTRPEVLQLLQRQKMKV